MRKAVCGPGSIALWVALASAPNAAGQKPAAPAPFGIAPGATVDQIMAMGGTMTNDGIWLIARPPRPHVDFTIVSAYANRAAGACGVFAMTKATANMTSLSETTLRLLDLYGFPSRLGTAGISYPPPILKLKADSLDVIWSRPTSSKLPAAIKQIRVRPILTDDDEWYVSIFYQFSNWDKCRSGLGGDAAGSLGP